MEDDRETPPVAWWAGPRIRLAVLLVCLGGAIVLLLGTRTSLLGAAAIGGGDAQGASNAPTWCTPRGLPAPTDADPEALIALRARLLRVFALYGGQRYVGGIATPGDMWSDDLPLRLRSSRLADGLWPAGYEMRWWTRDYDVGADVFAFGGSRQARELFKVAASTDCHRDGVLWPAFSPPRARNLMWVNPDLARQSDVFLLRGSRVYRIAAVRLQGAPAESVQAQRRTGARLLDALACVLPDAQCKASGAVRGVHSAG
ncbi:MAG TPA: hypothetical protein VNV42_10515 [Solirubrobacteraceae bacterium]|nr:hypothetical protein [Solirubrobacteraceae bacterium]